MATMKPLKSNNTVFRTRIDSDLKAQLEAQARSEDLTASQLVRRLIREYVHEHQTGLAEHDGQK